MEDSDRLKGALNAFCRIASELHLPPEKLQTKLTEVYAGWYGKLHLPVNSESLMEKMAATNNVEDCIQEFLEALRFGKEEYPAILPQRKSGEYSHTVRKAIQYIEDHYQEALSVSVVAEYVGKSDNHFSAIFKKEAGISFTEYITRLRIEKACRLLRQTTRQVKEISQEVGFSDYLYFSRTFKKVMGCTPSDVRRVMG